MRKRSVGRRERGGRRGGREEGRGGKGERERDGVRGEEETSVVASSNTIHTWKLCV